jgi:uncharacterized membrane protein
MTATLTWPVLLPAAAYAVSRPTGLPLAHAAAALPYLIGAVICHQAPERSFHLWGQQLPVCARCAGIYVGAGLAVLAAAFRTTRVRIASNPARTVTAARIALTIAAAPTIATLAYEWVTADATSNIVRALAGLPLGAAAAWVVLTAADDQVN